MHPDPHAQQHPHPDLYSPPHQDDSYDPGHCPEWKNENLDTPDYQALSAACKQQIMWKRVIADREPQKFFVGPEFQGFFEQDMNLSFDTVSDTMPVGRIKRTHPVGTTTLIEFIPAYDTPYTGMFRGAKHGIMRISEFA